MARGLLASLRARLVLALLAASLLGAAAMTGLSALDRNKASDVLEDHTLATQAEDLGAGLRFAPSGALAGVVPGPEWRAAYARPGAAAFTVFGPSRRPEASSPNLTKPLAYRAAEPGPWNRAVRLDPDTGDLLLSVQAPHGYTMVVSRGQPGALAELEESWVDDFAGVGVLLVSALLAGGAVWGMAGWSLQPFSRAARQLDAVEADGPNAFETAALPLEARPFAASVARALARVGDAYDAQRRFTADAAHALRTPVAVMDLRVQRAASGAPLDLNALRGDLDAIARTVSGLLSLARADSAPTEPRPAADLARIVREVVASMEPLLKASGRTIVVDAEGPHHAAAEPRAVRDAVTALVENALVHGGGTITLRFEEGESEVRLEVCDLGPGVSEADRERAFERFWKAEGAAPGAGLGLAIVRSVARSAGGDARFTGPSTVALILPRAEVPPAAGRSAAGATLDDDLDHVAQS